MKTEKRPIETVLMKPKSLFLILITLLLFSCKKEDLTPAWLVINEIQLQTDEGTEGPNSNAITDAWIYLDNVPFGVYSLPAKIPVLEEGEHELIIYAGIKENGISATRVRYPFYTRYDAKVNFVKNQETTITPLVFYKSNVQFELKEDFEDVGVDFEKDAISDTNIVIITNADYPEIVKYGNNCGKIELSESDSIYKGFTNTTMNLPKNKDVFLEIDYMNTNSLATNIIAKNSGGTAEHPPVFILNKQDPTSMVWKKIYINLKEDVSSEINATSYELYLLALLDPDNTAGVIYLDNIKVLRLE